MHNIILSICVPTCNQPDAVLRLLNSIKKQVIPNIEIIIQDDSDNAFTKNIVEKFIKDLPISYFGKRNLETGNLKKGKVGGLDRAILFLTQKARGEYIWWIGDDDIAEGALSVIFDIIRNHPALDFVFVNFRLGYTGLVNEFFSKETNIIGDRNKILKVFGGSLGFISATILKREKAITGIKGAEKFIGTAWANLYLVLHVLSQGNKFYFLKDPQIINFPNKPEEMNENGFEVFGVNFYSILKNFEDKFDKSVIKYVLKKNFHNVWKGMFVRWVTGYESPRRERWIMMRLYWRFYESWLALILFSMPKFINIIAYKLYKILNK